MLLSDAIKIFTVCVLVAVFFSSCRTASKNENQTLNQAPLTAEELKDSIPFSAKEPENFQTEIVITANDYERTTFIARRGENRRYDFDFGTKNQIAALHTDKSYLVLPEKKIYAEQAKELFQLPDETANFLTNKLLNSQTPGNFERLGSEENISAYRVRPENGESTEILIYVDESSGFPVRQEFYSVGNGQKILNFRFELRNLKIPADENLFTIPGDYRRVSETEFRKIARDAAR